MINLYWLTDDQTAPLQPYLPRATASHKWTTGG